LAAKIVAGVPGPIREHKRREHYRIFDRIACARRARSIVVEATRVRK
jgi:hypothetical protein